jgi:hypothetical protein
MQILRLKCTVPTRRINAASYQNVRLQSVQAAERINAAASLVNAPHPAPILARLPPLPPNLPMSSVNNSSNDKSHYGNNRVMRSSATPNWNQNHDWPVTMAPIAIDKEAATNNPIDAGAPVESSVPVKVFKPNSYSESSTTTRNVSSPQSQIGTMSSNLLMRGTSTTKSAYNTPIPLSPSTSRQAAPPPSAPALLPPVSKGFKKNQRILSSSISSSSSEVSSISSQSHQLESTSKKPTVKKNAISDTPVSFRFSRKKIHKGQTLRQCE